MLSRPVALFLVAAAVCVGEAIQLGGGAYDSAGIVWLGAGCVLAWLGVGMGIRAWKAPWVALGIAVGGMIFQAVELEMNEPLQDGLAPRWFYWGAVPLMLILVLGSFWRWRVMYLAAGVFFLAGLGLLRCSPSPHIDVYVVTRDSCVAMSRGVDPYSISFERVYADNPDWEKRFYPAGIISGNRTNFGYPYMPLSFYADFLGQALGGDFRLAHLAAIAIAAVLLASLGRALSVAGAGLLLLTPRVFHVVEYAWAEPVVVVCLALVMSCGVRKSRALPFVTGLLLVSKQHLILAAPVLIFLIPRPWDWKNIGIFLVKAGAAAAAATLPLVLWNFRAFWHSAVDLQLKNPFRDDSLNFAAWWNRNGGAAAPTWVAFGAAAIMAGVVIWRCPRTPAGFAAGLAGIYLAFFVLAKQAFCNYYFMVIGALCCAVAAWRKGEGLGAAGNN